MTTTTTDPQLRAAVRRALAAQGELAAGNRRPFAEALADMEQAVSRQVDADYELRREAIRWLRSITASDPRPFGTREIVRLLRHR
jgi:phenylalanyl-tRNA synthetase beta subunit